MSLFAALELLMQEIVGKISQYGSLIIGMAAGIMMLLLHIKQRRLKKLEIELLKKKQESAITPLQERADKAHEIAEEARKKYEEAMRNYTNRDEH